MMAPPRSSSGSGKRIQTSSLRRSSGASSGIGLVQQITHPAHRPDVDARPFELLAEAVDEDLDRVAADLLAPAVKVVDHLLLGDDAALAQHQELDDRELARRDLDRLVVAIEPPTDRVEPQPAVAQ